MLRLAVLIVAVLGCLLATGCSPVVRERTLPASIRNVYVPMIVNRSSEPGIEEELTASLQQEILADGRLNLVPEKNADAIVKITVTDFDTITRGLDSDDYPTAQLYDLKASMQILENIPGRPRVGGIRKLSVTHGFGADPRSSGYEPEPRQKERLYKSFGFQTTLELITGQFQENEPVNNERDSNDRNALPTFGTEY